MNSNVILHGTEQGPGCPIGLVSRVEAFSTKCTTQMSPAPPLPRLSAPPPPLLNAECECTYFTMCPACGLGLRPGSEIFVGCIKRGINPPKKCVGGGSNATRATRSTKGKNAHWQGAGCNSAQRLTPRPGCRGYAGLLAQEHAGGHLEVQVGVFQIGIQG